ncbi:hypothetical protein CEXT_529861 [Caerostris extrusa]|uniref:Ycf15 n=1 Tax=Caerostris extrusa TaxID=172846 RepID=A0AAV4YB70_CAEEX|nr:hypothetical protein CEXT_529861 [Caerostris extrusa]
MGPRELREGGNAIKTARDCVDLPLESVACLDYGRILIRKPIKRISPSSHGNQFGTRILQESDPGTSRCFMDLKDG